MASEILTVTTPMLANVDVGQIPFETILADLDGDGSSERVEIDTSPRIEGSPFREWRVYRDDLLVHACAGIDVAVLQAQDGKEVIVSDGAFWTFATPTLFMPYGDMISERTKYLSMGTDQDRDVLDDFGLKGIFRDNVRVFTLRLSKGDGLHRVITGGGYAFMDRDSETSMFVITDSDHTPLFSGWARTSPWIFRNKEGLTLISDSIFGYQISIIQGGL